jgi:uncharacterized membrane protein YecN with MAPEG domain
MAPVTTLYAAVLALWVVVLLLRVVLLRWRSRAGEGDGGNRDLAKAIRVHANSIETLPIALLLMFGYELGGGSSDWLHACGILLVVGRLAHARGLSRTFGVSAGRIAGTTTVLVVIISLAALILAAHINVNP